MSSWQQNLWTSCRGAKVRVNFEAAAGETAATESAERLFNKTVDLKQKGSSE